MLNLHSFDMGQVELIRIYYQTGFAVNRDSKSLLGLDRNIRIFITVLFHF